MTLAAPSDAQQTERVTAVGFRPVPGSEYRYRLRTNS